MPFTVGIDGKFVYWPPNPLGEMFPLQSMLEGLSPQAGGGGGNFTYNPKTPNLPVPYNSNLPVLYNQGGGGGFQGPPKPPTPPSGAAASGAGGAESAAAQAAKRGLFSRLLMNPVMAGLGGMSVLDSLIGREPTPEEKAGTLSPYYTASQNLLQKAASPESTPAEELLYGTLGGIVGVPSRLQAGLEDIGTGIKDFFFTPKKNQKGKEQQPQADSSAAFEQFKLQMGQGLGGEESGQQIIDLGPADQVPGNYEMPSIPLPPPNIRPDYSKVRDLVEQLRPEAVDQKKYDDMKGMAILAGMASGLINADQRNIGNILLNLGMGSLAGQATLDAAKKDAEENFKKSMRDYVGDALKVEKAASDSDADYAERIWQTNLQTSKMALEDYYIRRRQKEAQQNKFMRIGDTLVRVENRGGREVAVPITISQISNTGNMTRVFQAMGMPEKEAKTHAIMSNAADVADRYPLMVATELKSRGLVEPFLNDMAKMGEQGKNFVKQYKSAGTSLISPVADQKSVEKQAEAQRDTLFFQAIKDNPNLMYMALRYINPVEAEAFRKQILGGK